MSTQTKSAKSARGNIFIRIGNYFKDVVAELKRVSWPERKELISYTVAVIIFVVIMGSLIGLLDLGFSQAAKLLLGS